MNFKYVKLVKGEKLSSFLFFSVPLSLRNNCKLLRHTFELSSWGPRYGDVLIR